MSEWIYGNITKPDGTPVVKNIRMAIDKLARKEAAEYQSGDPHFTYNFSTWQLPLNNLTLIQQKYYVIDQHILDPVTNQLRKFLIISDPHPQMLMMIWSWVAYRYRGA